MTTKDPKKEELKKEDVKDAPKTDAKKSEAPKKDAPEGEDGKKPKVKMTAAQKKKSKRRSITEGDIHIHASYNNTIITVTEPNGDVISWASAGASGFRGARKATPYAAQIAAENAIQKAQIYGFERAHIYIKGVGSGREQSMRGITANNVELLSITDVTSMPHNGCRKKKRRRV
jgi:small subunit ribosomal protein S11